MPVGDAYAPKCGSRVIFWMKAEDGHEPDRLEGRVLSHVSWEDEDGVERLNVNLRTSWSSVSVPLHRVQQVTNLDARDAQRAASGSPFADWVSRSRDAAFEAEKADMLGRIDTELIRPPGRDLRRSED